VEYESRHYKLRINCDGVGTNFGLQDGINLINLQAPIEFTNKSRIDGIASVHAFPLVFLKNVVNEVKWRHHHILPDNSPFYDNGLLLNSSPCSSNLRFGPFVRHICNIEQREMHQK
jgi:hypothetical protein